ncbi:GntR family transcriptional regulator [uncultured Pseudonocardia sp.]|uniref:GntR family transcriptional regulator n=1 Tax=uncultured Pseudonocardia sp. TaxID=211455 RepID=UPI00345BAAEB
MCARLGWDMHIHQFRHYSATELISAGVDVRTVAGRLGHGGGGSTTLRVYSAWISESDQKAAGTIAVRMPTPPISLSTEPSSRSEASPPRNTDSPYVQIAADLRGAIACGALGVGAFLPTVEQLKDRYRVSSGTANRAIAVLKDAGLVTASRGRRAAVATLYEAIETPGSKRFPQTERR